VSANVFWKCAVPDGIAYNAGKVFNDETFLKVTVEQKLYTLTVEGGGTIRNPNGTAHSTGLFGEGERVNIAPFSLIPPGYRFIGWKAEDSDSGDPVTIDFIYPNEGIATFPYEGITSFYMPAKNITVTPEWEYQSVTVRHNVTVIGGLIVQSTEENHTIPAAGISSGSFLTGTGIYIKAAIPKGYTFVKWEVTPVNSGEIKYEVANTIFHLLADDASGSADITVTAVLEEAKYNLKVNGGSAAQQGPHRAEDSIDVYAAPPAGMKFSGWVGDGGEFKIITEEHYQYIMPDHDSEITAVFEYFDGFRLTVINGVDDSIDASDGVSLRKLHYYNERVSIKANPAPEGEEFDRWVTSGGGAFVNQLSAETSFYMPAGDVTVTATYKSYKKADGEESNPPASQEVQNDRTDEPVLASAGRPRGDDSDKMVDDVASAAGFPAESEFLEISSPDNISAVLSQILAAASIALFLRRPRLTGYLRTAGSAAKQAKDLAADTTSVKNGIDI
jgi:hypothetical protein